MSKEYMELAEQAAQFEREEHYQRAHAFCLLGEINRAWATNRADFCSKPRASKTV